MKKVSLIVILSLIMLPLLSSCKDKTEKKEEVEVETEVKMETEAPLNTLTQAEKDEGWVMLFDGETSEGWRGYKKDHFPEAWKIADGTLHIVGSGRGEAGNKDGGDIIYDKQFDNFNLSLEWKVS